EELVTEPGRASYYSDPYFWSYFIQPAAHNTILVDDFPESQFAGDYKNEMTGFNKYARLKDALVSDAGGFLVSELAPVYHSDLETMQRRIWFIDPGYVVIDDRVRSNGEAHTYQMQLHPPNLPSLAIDGDRARVTGEQSTLDIQVLMPDAPRLIKKQYPLANRDIDVENLLPKGALQVTHDSPQRNQEFRVVLTPRRDGMDFPSSIREVEGDNFKAIEASFSDGRRDRIYFRTGDDISDQIETDAQTAFISLNAEGKVRAAGFEGATHFQIGDRFSFSSEYPGHGMFHLHEDGERIRLSRGLLDTGSVPASVTTQSVGEVRENLSSPESGNGLIERTQGAEQTRLDVNLSGEPLEIDILYNE
ncbi:MAG: heparinase II/III family protein, partial [Balneolaceae bacterium]